MKGLALAEQYYNVFGKKMIETRFSQYKNRIAAGLVGPGSECFGFDDSLSRDHDWGPGICLWLTDEDDTLFGAELQQAYNDLPSSYQGFIRNRSKWGGKKVGVLRMDEFYRSLMGSPRAPTTLVKWLTITEANLATCSNGKVFYDPMGQFSDVRNDLKKYYPEEVRLKKISARLMSAAQSGQYNYSRCVKRGHLFSQSQSLIKFCEECLGLVFLFNRCFAPFYKWSYQAAKKLPILGDLITQRIDSLLSQENPGLAQQMIEEICQLIIKELYRQQLSDVSSDFLLDHGPSVHSQITDTRLKKS